MKKYKKNFWIITENKVFFLYKNFTQAKYESQKNL